MYANSLPILPLTLAAVALLLVLILLVRLHAALALVITSMALGLAAGMNPAAVLASIQKGFGEALGFIAIVLGLGAIIGVYIESSGGGRVLADWLLEKFGRERAVWAVLLAAFLVGLPLFFEVAFIVLIPVIWSLTKESKTSLLFFGIPMAMAMTVLHAMVPLHPGAAAAAQLLGADFGKAMLYGIALSVPMIIVGGLIYGKWIARRIFVPLPAFADQPEIVREGKAPAVGLVIFLLILPVLLIAARFLDQQNRVLQFFGHPFTALTVTALSSMVFLGALRGLDPEQTHQTRNGFVSADRQPVVHHGSGRRAETDHRGYRCGRLDGKTTGVVARVAAAGGVSDVGTHATGAGVGDGGHPHGRGDHCADG